MIQWMLAIWSLVPLPFLKPAWTSGSSRFTYCWSSPTRDGNCAPCNGSAEVGFFFRDFNFIYFWLCWIFLAVWGLSLVMAKWGYSLLWCVDFSTWWLLLMPITISRTQARQLWHISLVALQYVESSQTRDGICVPCIRRQTLYHWATREVPGNCTWGG